MQSMQSRQQHWHCEFSIVTRTLLKRDDQMTRDDQSPRVLYMRLHSFTLL